MASEFTRDACPCGQFPPMIMLTNREDDAIVFATMTMVRLRCRLCGRKKDGRLVPGDATLGEHLASEGYGGRPRFSMEAAKRGDLSQPTAPFSEREWQPARMTS